MAPRRLRRGDGAALRPRCNDCATPHDAGGAPHVAIDAIILRRDARASDSCAALRRNPPPVAPFPDGWGTSNEANDDDAPPPLIRERRSVELSLVAIILGTAASFLLGICAAALTSRVTRRPSETILTPHKGYGLVEEKRSPEPPATGEKLSPGDPRPAGPRGTLGRPFTK